MSAKDNSNDCKNLHKNLKCILELQTTPSTLKKKKQITATSPKFIIRPPKYTLSSATLLTVQRDIKMLHLIT